LVSICLSFTVFCSCSAKDKVQEQIPADKAEEMEKVSEDANQESGKADRHTKDADKGEQASDILIAPGESQKPETEFEEKDERVPETGSQIAESPKAESETRQETETEKKAPESVVADEPNSPTKNSGEVGIISEEDMENGTVESVEIDPSMPGWSQFYTE
jgi:hypothetical protein